MIWLGVTLLLASAVFSHRYAWWRPAVDNSHPRILMYHMVSEHRPRARFNKLRVPPAMFEYQVRWLKQNGWHFALMSELADPAALPAKTVLLTFDDGFEDNYRNAHPILQKYGACATLYLVVDRFDRDWSTSKKAHHDSGELMHEPKLSDDQVRAMLASGCWELGGHTRTHANLARLDAIGKKAEIADGREQLEQRFDAPVRSFAYPFGIYDAQDVRLTEAAGFDNAVTTVEGIDADICARRFELSRVKVSGKDSRLAFRLRMRTGRRS
ncbi:polysaccharide deacetylase family protein [Marinobacterium sedimentorum]|uniref:polysaccharide deacetylase family protein n=1 Tax=Marinobacterium sedimentorum TaxID=2927804 RepID=UPI0020C66B3E|nr:polysaccharide deacetylase family protein [Marinobacterium sedimentorum]MCP8686265.1 polysaccharide deacetylase family protein [Marinobacterium sedimentorum]